MQVYGWRGRLGILVPATNATAENEYRRLADTFDGLSVHVARVQGVPGPVSRDWEVEFGEGCVEAARRLASVEPGLIAVANTSGTFINDETALAAEISAATGIAVVTTANAVVMSLRDLGARSIGVVTPYPAAFNGYLTEYLTGSGFDVVSFESNLTEDILTIGRYGPQEAYRLARRLTGNFEAVFISCTDFRTIDVIPALESDLRVPVISSNFATFTQCARTLGIGLPPEPYRLWAEITVRGRSQSEALTA